MTADRSHDPWADACLAAAMLAVDPAGLGGAVVRTAAGPVRDRWLAHLTALLPEPPLRLSPATPPDQFDDGLDLAATLAAGRPVTMPGLLSRAAGGTVLLPMAERTEPGLGGRLGQALDRRLFAVVALDEGEPGEAPSPGLTDRLALQLDFSTVSVRETGKTTRHDIASARALLPRVRIGEAMIESLTEAAFSLAIPSLRAPLLAIRVARAAAALSGRTETLKEDAALAARLVLARRARAFPDPAETAEPPPDPPDPSPDTADRSATAEGDLLIEAAAAALPPDVLAALGKGVQQHRRAGQSGGPAKAPERGRRAGNRRGRPGGGPRLDIVGTLRAAAPWQPVRRGAGPGGGRIQIRADDFRIHRLKARAESAAVFIVDASGSAALARLAEAKGAVELMLAQAYVRREQVALIAFRGEGAEVLLHPTRAPARARRELARLPGGGGTPLAAGLAAGIEMAGRLARRGVEPRLVVLTDGAANIALDGAPGRAEAQDDARRTGSAIRAAGWPAVLIDTARRPQQSAAELAAGMGARYLALPFADARTISRAAGQ